MGTTWCNACRSAIEPIPTTTLAGVPLLAAGRFAGPLQRAIHTYKYSGRQELAGRLAPLLIQAVGESGVRADGVVFVPLHPERQRERGFNQAERLATELARTLSLPLIRGLARVRATPAQVGLGQAERRVNLLGGFAWAGPSPPPAGVVLVDDVCTTGATLEAAAAALSQAGGSVAAFAVLARAQTLAPLAVTSPEQSACS